MTTTTDQPVTAGDLVRRARAAVPGQDPDTTDRALAAIDDGRKHLTAEVTAGSLGDRRAALLAEVAVGLLDGKPVPADLGAQLTALEDEDEARGRAFAALTELREELRRRAYAAEGSHAELELDVLRTELGRILGQARDVLPELGPARTADEAIERGPVCTDAFRRARSLAGELVELRRAQTTIVGAALRRWEDRHGAGSIGGLSIAAAVAVHGSFAEHTGSLPGEPIDLLVTSATGEGHDGATLVAEVTPVDDLVDRAQEAHQGAEQARVERERHAQHLKTLAAPEDRARYLAEHNLDPAQLPKQHIALGVHP